MTASYSDGSSEDVTDSASLSSSDSSVASVLGPTITGESSGTATIEATYGVESDTARVTVEEGEETENEQSDTAQDDSETTGQSSEATDDEQTTEEDASGEDGEATDDDAGDAESDSDTDAETEQSDEQEADPDQDPDDDSLLPVSPMLLLPLVVAIAALAAVRRFGVETLAGAGGSAMTSVQSAVGAGGTILLQNDTDFPRRCRVRCRTPSDTVLFEDLEVDGSAAETLGEVPDEPFEIAVNVEDGPQIERQIDGADSVEVHIAQGGIWLK